MKRTAGSAADLPSPSWPYPPPLLALDRACLAPQRGDRPAVPRRRPAAPPDRSRRRDRVRDLRLIWAGEGLRRGTTGSLAGRRAGHAGSVLHRDLRIPRPVRSGRDPARRAGADGLGTRTLVEREGSLGSGVLVGLGAAIKTTVPPLLVVLPLLASSRSRSEAAKLVAAALAVPPPLLAIAPFLVLSTPPHRGAGSASLPGAAWGFGGLSLVTDPSSASAWYLWTNRGVICTTGGATRPLANSSHSTPARSRCSRCSGSWRSWSATARPRSTAPCSCG